MRPTSFPRRKALPRIRPSTWRAGRSTSTATRLRWLAGSTPVRASSAAAAAPAPITSVHWLRCSRGGAEIAAPRIEPGSATGSDREAKRPARRKMCHSPETAAGRLPSRDVECDPATLVVLPRERTGACEPWHAVCSSRCPEGRTARIVHCARGGYPSHRTACDEPTRAHLFRGEGRPARGRRIRAERASCSRYGYAWSAQPAWSGDAPARTIERAFARWTACP